MGHAELEALREGVVGLGQGRNVFLSHSGVESGPVPVGGGLGVHARTMLYVSVPFCACVCKSVFK